MKKITLLLSFIACVLAAQAQTLLVEDFNYAIGSDIKSHGWPIHSGSGATKDSILVVDGLTFNGYIGSAMGGAAAITGRYCDHNHTFASQTSGAVYVCFMFKSQGAGAGASYFLHLAPTNIASNTFFTRVWINATGDGLGIGASAPLTFLPVSINSTYLVVVKYDFATKISSLYLFNTLPSSEPSAAGVSFTETTGPAAATPTDIGAIALRQGQTNSLANQNVIVDGIRITKSWAELFTATSISNPTVSALNIKMVGKKLSVFNVNTSTIEIFSAIGTKVQTIELVNGTADLSQFTKGMYIVRVGKQTAKIML